MAEVSIHIDASPEAIWLVTVSANHVITPSIAGGADVQLTTEEQGLVAPLVRRFAGRRVLRYMQMEADGLKRRSES
jgi:hypothetical protein